MASIIVVYSPHNRLEVPTKEQLPKGCMTAALRDIEEPGSDDAIRSLIARLTEMLFTDDPLQSSSKDVRE